MGRLPRIRQSPSLICAPRSGYLCFMASRSACTDDPETWEGIEVATIEAVRRHAYLAAFGVTNDSVTAELAGDHAMDALRGMCRDGTAVRRLGPWARRVGRNFAVSVVRRRRRVAGLVEIDTIQVAPSGTPSCDVRTLLVTLAKDPRVRLTRRQRTVLETLDPNGSMKANARAVGMAPFALRRMLKCIGRRVIPKCVSISWPQFA